jgi:hypothetical protein
MEEQVFKIQVDIYFEFVLINTNSYNYTQFSKLKPSTLAKLLLLFKFDFH